MIPDHLLWLTTSTCATVHSRSARDLLQASTLEAIEKMAADYRKKFKQHLKSEKLLVESIPFDVNTQQEGFAARAKQAGYRLLHLPNIPAGPRVLEGLILDAALFEELSSQHQKRVYKLVSDLTAGSEPVVLAFKQPMSDEEVYAPLLSGDKAKLSWRTCQPPWDHPDCCGAGADRRKPSAAWSRPFSISQRK